MTARRMLLACVVAGIASNSVGSKALFKTRRQFPVLSKFSHSEMPSRSRVPSTFDGASGFRPNIRRVDKVQTPPRLPVWPVTNGLGLLLLDALGQKGLARKLEDRIGGRVSPMILDYSDTNPFVLLVHHRHSFTKFDPIRPLSNLVIPEGFPAHPHRGFETITYVLKGGFVHRDSIGVKMRYWAESGSKPAVQWLTAGRGILHEEMWDSEKGKESTKGLASLTSQQELFQIWLNLPRSHKLSKPKIQLLGSGCIDRNLNQDTYGEVQPIDIPVVTDESPGVTVRVLAGGFGERTCKVETATDVTLLHIMLDHNSTFQTVDIPQQHTVFFYVRKGAVKVGEDTIDTHQLCTLERSSVAGRVVRLEAFDPEGADILFFSGEPINEPIATKGSMVMNTDYEILKAYQDYEYGEFGYPWDEKLHDDEWAQHVRNRQPKSMDV
ncbi:hypothetical protein AAMO2058_000580000 [Amorphochlora amoebiformis]